jgi:hypothetical protein
MKGVGKNRVSLSYNREDLPTDAGIGESQFQEMSCIKIL